MSCQDAISLIIDKKLFAVVYRVTIDFVNTVANNKKQITNEMIHSIHPSVEAAQKSIEEHIEHMKPAIPPYSWITYQAMDEIDPSFQIMEYKADIQNLARMPEIKDLHPIGSKKQNVLYIGQTCYKISN
jgi:hypothetical protein